MFLLSGETIMIEMVLPLVSGPYSLYADSGRVVGVDERHWRWTAPRHPGRYQLVLTDAAMSDPVVIEAEVLEQAARDRTPEQYGGLMA
jgi:hypothetical protein